MKVKEELEIQELAEIINKTPQSIYDRLGKKDNIIQQYVVPGSQPKKMYKSVIQEVYGIAIESLESGGIEGNSSTFESTCTSPSSSIENDYLKNKISFLEQTIETQKEELQNKNNTINELTRLLDQQQQLSLSDKKRILELEAGREEKQEQEKEKERKGIYNWFNWFKK